MWNNYQVYSEAGWAGSYYKTLEVPKIQGDVTVINVCTLSIHQRTWLLGTSMFLILPLSISLESLLGVLLLGSHILSCPLTSGDKEQLSSSMVSSNLIYTPANMIAHEFIKHFSLA